MTYCNDLDLLHWEPTILADAAFASQTLLDADASLDGTLLTLSAGSWLTSQVSAGDVAVLSGAVNGCFPIASVNSATDATITVFRGSRTDETPIPPPNAGAVHVVVRTFLPQREIVASMLERAVDLRPGETLLNPGSLKLAAVAGTLQMIFSALAALAEEPAHYNVRADLYERLYRKQLRSVAVEVDTNGDGQPEYRRSLGVLRLLQR
jgi:hypothetical protein